MTSGPGASQIQLSLTGVLVGLAVSQLIVGPLADAFGRRRPALWGLSCSWSHSLPSPRRFRPNAEPRASLSGSPCLVPRLAS